MSKRRQEKTAEEVKRILANIIKELKDPRIDFSTVSVTRVDLSNDLSHARVNISVLADEERQEEIIQVIQKAKGYIRSELAGEIQLRHAPDLDFRLDRSIEHGIRISSLLEDLDKGKANNDEKS